jgi:hypothetical protein
VFGSQVLAIESSSSAQVRGCRSPKLLREKTFFTEVLSSFAISVAGVEVVGTLIVKRRFENLGDRVQKHFDEKGLSHKVPTVV